MIQKRSLVAVPLAIIGLSVAASAAAPQVVETIPENGATDVDPGLREIVVKFDQPMSRRAYSWCGGGETFPKTRGRAIWKDDRTCVLPVKLEPNHEYVMAVNCPAADNFRSKGGTPAVSQTLSFKTRGEGEAPAEGEGEDLTAVNTESVEMLKMLIDEHYSYRDLHKIKWDSVFKRHTPKLVEAKSPREFAEAAGKMLAVARDIHMTLKVDDDWFATYRRNVPGNLNWPQMDDLVPNFEQHNKTVATGHWDDEIGYIAILGWPSAPEETQPAFEALEKFADYDGLIIDVRANSGGDEPTAQRFAGHFVDKPVVYAKNDIRDPDEDSGFTQVYERTLQPAESGKRYKGSVVVLSGEYVMSSCEAFVLMMKQVPGCKIIGETTYGSSGNPQPYALPNGVTVNIPCWRAMTADGKPFEGKGIKPDIEVKTKRTDFMGKDPVLARALKELKSM